jgi:predicted metal-binding transcription factor (methanogenesis marker protein 9)
MSKLWVLLALILLSSNCYTILKLRETRNLYTEVLQREEMNDRELQKCKRDLKETIGTQAGEAIKQVKASATQTYTVLNEQAEESKEELEKLATNALIVLNQQAEKTTKDLQQVTNEMLQTLNRELEKYKAASE